MTPDAYYHRLISGRQRGLTASMLRGGLTLLSWPYRGIVGLRNAYYDRVGPGVRRAGIPVISVGNLVTGGTGKTPMVIWILQRLVAGGHRPGVLMRGYKASPTGCCRAHQALNDAIHGCDNDEAREIRRRCPQGGLVIDPNRVAGAARAVAIGCDVLVMDDGFQHRRLGRDLDVVLVDATDPFGSGLVPRGMLREPPTSLRRADLVIATRADQIPAESLSALKQQLTELAPRARVLAARHRPIELCDQRGRSDPDVPLDRVTGRAWLFAGLGNPNAFTTTVEQMGFSVVGQRFWPDHHTWTDAELAHMARQARQAGPDLVLTTEKDAVKLPPDRPDWPAPLRVVRIGIEFLDDDAGRMCERIDRVVGREGSPADHEDPPDDQALSTD